MKPIFHESDENMESRPPVIPPIPGPFVESFSAASLILSAAAAWARIIPAYLGADLCTLGLCQWGLPFNGLPSPQGG